MAEISELFNTLSNSGVGSAPDQKSAGDAPGVGSNAFAYRDSAGNLILPQLNASGQLPVTLGAMGTKLSANGTGTGIIATDVDVATLATLTISKLHGAIEVTTAATRTTLWKLVQIDDATTNVLAEWITGSGQYSFCCSYENIEFTTGGSGTQTLKIVGNQLQANPTDLHGTIAALEAA